MKIVCIGRNYAAHAHELSNAIPESPVFFMKPDTAMLLKNNPFFYPSFTRDLHYETEIVIKISKNGRHIEQDFAHRYYNEVSVGIDFTARDLQNNCKAKCLPWEIAKSFDQSAPVGTFIKLDTLPDRENIHFWLDINHERKQTGTTLDMLFNFNQLIAYVSRFVTLRIGDFIFTGTPAGVGPTKIGDHFEAYIEDQKLLDFNVK